MAGDIDAGFSPVDACFPGALGARDVAVSIELGSVLAEVPDVAVRVLAVPVGRALLEPAPHVEAIAHRDAGHTFDAPDPVGGYDDVASGVTVLDSGVDPAGARQKREPRVVDPRAEARWRGHRRGATGPLRARLRRVRGCSERRRDGQCTAELESACLH